MFYGKNSEMEKKIGKSEFLIVRINIFLRKCYFINNPKNENYHVINKNYRHFKKQFLINKCHL